MESPYTVAVDPRRFAAFHDAFMWAAQRDATWSVKHKEQQCTLLVTFGDLDSAILFKLRFV
jgi:hypothetical protein